MSVGPETPPIYDQSNNNANSSRALELAQSLIQYRGRDYYTHGHTRHFLSGLTTGLQGLEPRFQPSMSPNHRQKLAQGHELGQELKAYIKPK